jgi:UDP-2,3-diacylglucosamine pyrophosphatase LpxH
LMEKITKVDLPKRGQIHNYFVASDWHSFHLNMDCYRALLRHAKHFPKSERRLIINGDFLDIWYFMKRNDQFKKWVKRSDGLDEFFIPHWEEEVAWGNKILDELQQVFSNIWFVSGNHDKPRTDFFQSICPVNYKHNFQFEEALHFAKRRIPFIDYNNWLDIGHLSITHGMFHGTSAHKKHYEASGCRSVIFGHIHHDNKVSFMSRGNTRQVHSLPAMCDLNPDYIKNAETNWTNGYMNILIKSDGNFNAYTYTMWDKVIIDPYGKII